MHQQPLSGGMLLVRGRKEVSRNYSARRGSFELRREQVTDVVDVEVVRCG
jgi:hypothetical protein